MISIVLLNVVPIALLLVLIRALGRSESALFFGAVRISRSRPVTYWLVIAALVAALAVTGLVAVLIDLAMINRGSSG